MPWDVSSGVERTALMVNIRACYCNMTARYCEQGLHGDLRREAGEMRDGGPAALNLGIVVTIMDFAARHVRSLLVVNLVC